MLTTTLCLVLKTREYRADLMLDGLSYCCSREVPCCEWGLLLVLATLDDDKSSFDTQLLHLPFAPKNLVVKIPCTHKRF